MIRRLGLGRRARRPDDGKHTPHDARLFRRLIRQARYIARAPTAAADALLKAAEAAGKAVPPPGHARRDSDFLKLIVEGRLWWRYTALQRHAGAGNLALLCDACETALDGGSADPLTRPPRLDIFG